MINNAKTGVTTGIINIDDKLVILIDFEKIVADITPDVGINLKDIDGLGDRRKNNQPIIYAEDSQLLGKMLLDCLKRAGFNNVDITANGKECWDKLTAYEQKGVLDKKVACVITDIEMPQMDGHHLTKKIKEDPRFEGLPVVIFSSLVNDEMKRKGEALGVDAQLSKPEIGRLVHQLDLLLK